MRLARSWSIAAFLVLCLVSTAGAQAPAKKPNILHLDGYNLMPFFKGEGKASPRQEFLY